MAAAVDKAIYRSTTDARRTKFKRPQCPKAESTSYRTVFNQVAARLALLVDANKQSYSYNVRQFHAGTAGSGTIFTGSSLLMSHDCGRKSTRECIPLIFLRGNCVLTIGIEESCRIPQFPTFFFHQNRRDRIRQVRRQVVRIYTSG